MSLDSISMERLPAGHFNSELIRNIKGSITGLLHPNGEMMSLAYPFVRDIFYSILKGIIDTLARLNLICVMERT